MILSTLVCVAVPLDFRAVSLPKTAGSIGEWEITGLPTPEDPYNPQSWSVVVSVAAEGKKPKVFHGFWREGAFIEKQPDGGWKGRSKGKGSWRVRWTPLNGGSHRLTAAVYRSGRLLGRTETRVKVASAPVKGFLKVSPENPHYFAHRDGSRFLAIGWNACWWTGGGLADYEMWAEAMQKAGMNFTRLWMSPWCFGIETDPSSLGRYDQGAAEALDRALAIFQKRGIQVMLCLDYHGMLNDVKDFWGSNDNWRLNPYNAVNGGPAKTQNDFFTNEEARKLYKRRLRYLAARFGAHPNVAFWEFWNEIDNVRNRYRAADMIAWHKEMTDEIRSLDPYGRLVTTSLTSDIFPDLWRAPNLDLVQSHSYNQSNPGPNFAARAAKFRRDFNRPWLMGEYGVDFRAPKLEDDPQSRGLKQALWGTLVGGSAGSAQSWWWETLHTQGVYPLFRSLADFVKASPIGSRGWSPMAVESGGGAQILPPLPNGGLPFDVTAPLAQEWESGGKGTAILLDLAGAAGQASQLSGFVHGSSKPELKRPFRILAHFGAGGRVGVKVNSVSDLAILEFWVDGVKKLEKSFPDKDGKTDVSNEFAEEVWVDVPAGRREVELRNTGRDWAALDWLQAKGVLPSGATPEEGISLKGAASGTPTAAAVWLLDPSVSYPANAKQALAREVANGSASLSGVEDGTWEIRWWSTGSGGWKGVTRSRAHGGILRLTPPPFREDIAGLARRVGP
jgi:hypothetical protein